ncbi:hypothetical protein E2320_003592, partial [Naja naja]
MLWRILDLQKKKKGQRKKKKDGKYLESFVDKSFVSKLFFQSTANRKKNFAHGMSKQLPQNANKHKLETNFKKKEKLKM